MKPAQNFLSKSAKLFPEDQILLYGQQKPYKNSLKTLHTKQNTISNF
jgi:hypothetical protein